MPFTRRLLLTVAAIAALVLGPPSVALASPPDPHDPARIDNQDPALLAAMRKQEKLHPAAQALLEAATKLPADSGYAGVGYDGDSVSLYHKGPLPPEMAAVVARSRAAAPVAIRSSRYSWAELERAQAKLTAAVEKQHSDVQAIGVACDGSGLAVERMPAAMASAMRATLAANKGLSSTSAPALLAGLALDVPIILTTAPGSISFLCSREDDSLRGTEATSMKRGEAWTSGRHGARLVSGYGKVHSRTCSLPIIA